MNIMELYEDVKEKVSPYIAKVSERIAFGYAPEIIETVDWYVHPNEGEFSFENNGMSDWLYGEWNEDKLKKFEMMNNVPVLSNYMSYLLDRRADLEYLNRYGMDYSDIHDPRKLRQTSSGSSFVGSAVNYISDNVKKLYR